LDRDRYESVEDDRVADGPRRDDEHGNHRRDRRENRGASKSRCDEPGDCNAGEEEHRRGPDQHADSHQDPDPDGPPDRRGAVEHAEENEHGQRDRQRFGVEEAVELPREREQRGYERRDAGHPEPEEASREEPRDQDGRGREQESLEKGDPGG
jgi:hypothetical protein